MKETLDQLKFTWNIEQVREQVIILEIISVRIFFILLWFFFLHLKGKQFLSGIEEDLHAHRKTYLWSDWPKLIITEEIYFSFVWITTEVQSLIPIDRKA